MRERKSTESRALSQYLRDRRRPAISVLGSLKLEVATAATWPAACLDPVLNSCYVSQYACRRSTNIRRMSAAHVVCMPAVNRKRCKRPFICHRVGCLYVMGVSGRILQVTRLTRGLDTQPSSPPRCTKRKNPPARSQCTNFDMTL